MKTSNFFLLLFIASVILIVAAPVKSQDLSNNMSSGEYQTIAKEMILEFELIMNSIQDSFFEPDQIEDIIHYTYIENRDQLFYDSSAQIVNDLVPGDINFATMPAWKYLNRFHKVYRKYDNNTIDFFNIFVGPAEIHPDTVFVNVYFDSKFGGKNKKNKLPHLKVSKKATIAFYKIDGSWKPYIFSIDALPPNFEFSDEYLTNFFSDKMGVVGDIMERVYNNRVMVNYGNYEQTYYSDSSLVQHADVGEWYIPSTNTLRIQYRNDNVLLASKKLELNLKGKSLESFSYFGDKLYAGSPYFNLNTSGDTYSIFFPEENSLAVKVAHNHTTLDYNKEKTVDITNENTRFTYSVDIPFYINSKDEFIVKLTPGVAITPDEEGFSKSFLLP